MALLKVLLSSPSDIPDARNEAERQVELLNRDPDIYGWCQLEVLKWENAPAVAGRGPQEIVNHYTGRASECDIVICMFGRRYGTQTTVGGYQYPSGTAYEFQAAYKAHRRNRKGKPVILLYRILKDPPPQETSEEAKQAEEVEDFFSRFHGRDAVYLALHRGYRETEEFGAALGKHLKQVVLKDFARLDISSLVREVVNHPVQNFNRLLRLVVNRLGRAIDPIARRADMLKEVRRIWIEGVLSNMSAPVADSIKIGIRAVEELSGATKEHPLSLPLTSTDVDVRALFDDADHQLLILGEPGAGKTFKMLELLSSQLRRAEENPSVPIPVVFNLSSWARRGGPIADWLISELVSVYGLRPKLARHWVDGEELALFLDGLDEITASGAKPGSEQEADAQRLIENCRRKCIDELNDYVAGTGIWMVLCCREKEYVALGKKLRTRRENAASRIMPLTDTQVETYLSEAGPELESLRQALVEDNILREMARAPFLLTTMALAYRNDNAKAIVEGGQGSLEARRKDMLGKYVSARYRGTESAQVKRYKLGEIRHYLGQLAHMMEEGDSKLLLVEQLQPDRLPSSGHRLYVAFVCLLLVLAAWVIIGLPAGWAIGYERAGSSSILARLSQFNSWTMIVMTLSSGGFISLGFAFSKSWGFGIAWGINLGVARAITIGMGKGPDRFQPESLISSALENRHSWLLQGLVTLILGIFVLTLLMWVRGHARDKIYPFERRKLEMRSAFWGVISGLTVGVVFLAIFGLLRGLAFGIGLTLILVLGFGYRRTRFEMRVYPNQGIWNSASMALKTGIVAALTGLICFGTSYGAFLNRDHGVVNGILGLTLAVTSLWFGGMPLIQHVGLRLALARYRLAPLNLVGFLNAASELQLLRRVGGGYMFQHEYLRTYFREQRGGNRERTR